MITDSDIITLKDVAEYLRVHTSTVYRLCKRKAIPHFKIGSDFRFMRASIEGWLTEREHGSKQTD